jgi:hypothetical protein
VWTGDETFKLRHMDEPKLCEEYERKYLARNTGKPIPTLVIGHTHEPRRRATFTEGTTVNIVDYYLNSGAAGRFENLIWCVEIEGSTDRIVSWSRINGKLTRIAWKRQERPGARIEDRGRVSQGHSTGYRQPVKKRAVAKV